MYRCLISSFRDLQPAISRFALILFGITSSSASAERSFSELGPAKPKARKRMEMETLRGAGVVKLDLLNQSERQDTGEDDSDDWVWDYDPLDFIMDEDYSPGE